MRSKAETPPGGSHRGLRRLRIADLDQIQTTPLVRGEFGEECTRLLMGAGCKSHVGAVACFRVFALDSIEAHSYILWIEENTPANEQTCLIGADVVWIKW